MYSPVVLHSDSGIGRFRRSSGYPKDGKALSTHAMFDFLWQISPTCVMFAFAIATYCKLAEIMYDIVRYVKAHVASVCIV